MATAKLTSYRWPKSLVGRFIARRSLVSATFIALALGTFIASKVIGYASAYPTVQERTAGAALYTSNIGLEVLYGTPRHLESVAGFAVWYAMFLAILMGGIWAYLTATKTFRGEESAGRWELLLTGQTSLRRATAYAFTGLSASLLLFYVIIAATLVAVGQARGVGFGVGAALYFALAAVSAAVMFMAVGTLASQIMPTRSRAAGLSTAVFGISFLMRDAGDITQYHWILNFTPLGWIEKLQPIYDPQPFWLIPIIGFTMVLVGVSLYLAGKRDLGQSFVADHDTAKARTRLLNGPVQSSLRFSRGNTASWLGGLTLFATFFGGLTNTAAQAFSSSTAAQQMLERLIRVSHETAARTFLGIAFMLVIIVVMAYAAHIAGSVRNDEAQGYLDNLLARPISRQRWLWGRIGLGVTGIVLACLLAVVGIWLGMWGHHDTVSFQDILLAGLNVIAPACLTLGLGICAFGLWPRLTSLIAYSLIVWSFFIEMLGSGIQLSSWILNTSIFNHVALAPAVSPKLGSNVVIFCLAILLTSIGTFAFNRRDLANE